MARPAKPERGTGGACAGICFTRSDRVRFCAHKRCPASPPRCRNHRRKQRRQSRTVHKSAVRRGWPESNAAERQHPHCRLDKQAPADAFAGPGRIEIKLLDPVVLDSDEPDNPASGFGNGHLLARQHCVANKGQIFVRRMEHRHPAERCECRPHDPGDVGGVRTVCRTQRDLGWVSQRPLSRSSLRLDQPPLDQQLGDLHRVQRCALAQIVGDDPHRQAVIDGRILADARDVGGVLAGRIRPA